MICLNEIRTSIQDQIFSKYFRTISFSGFSLVAVTLVNIVLEVFSVLILPSSRSCTSQSSCRCHQSQEHLYADCSNLSLRQSPYFWSNVTRINLSNNLLRELPARSHLPDDLTYLDLSNNAIHRFTNDCFKGLWKLSDLRLNFNKLRVNEYLVDDAFADLINIKNLDLSHNPDLTFQVMPILTSGLQNSSIEVLRLNKIHCTFGLSTEVRINDVRSLKYTNLQELHMSSNRIELIENGALYFLPGTLKRISLADNRLAFGLYILELMELKSLEWLDTSMQHTTHNPVEVVNSIFSYCRNKREQRKIVHENTNALTYKTVNSANISKTDENKIQKTPDMLWGNKTINTIPVPPNMKSFFCNESGLRYRLPSVRLTKNRIENLYCQDNILYAWTGPILGLDSLRILNLSNNFCSKVSKDFFQYVSTVSELYLNDNLLGFSFVQDNDGHIFGNLHRLRHLELKANRISYFHKAVFKNLLNLEYLDLSNNKLTAIDFDIANLKSLRYLDLSVNQIQSLSDNNMNDIDVQAKRLIITLNLFKNPFVCDCKTLPFLTWMIHRHTNRKIRFKSFEQYSCSTSSPSGKIKFVVLEQHLEKLRKDCNSYSTVIFVVSVIICLFFFTVSGGLIYRQRWKLRYFYYMTKSRYHDYKSVKTNNQSDFKYDAFVSYAEEDRPFVEKLISELEAEDRLRLCIHHRDFVPGYNVAENVITAVNKSRKTIVILSPNFVKSDWCKYEIHIAKMEEIYSRADEGVLFLVLYEPVPADEIPLCIMDLIKQKSYIEFPNDEYGDCVFWRKVQETLENEIN